MVTCLCHITDTLYLVGFFSDKLRVWNEQNEQEMIVINCYYVIDGVSLCELVSAGDFVGLNVYYLQPTVTLPQ